MGRSTPVRRFRFHWEREIARYLLMSVLVWTLPLVVNDLWTLWRERFISFDFIYFQF